MSSRSTLWLHRVLHSLNTVPSSSLRGTVNGSLSSSRDCARVLVIGTGISGLNAAYNIRKAWIKSSDFPRRKLQIDIVDRHPRVGGCVRSDASSSYTLEFGPRALRSRGGRAALELIQELQLTDRIVPSNPNAKVRYTYDRGELLALEPFPMMLSSLGRTIIGGVLSEATRSPAPPADDFDESIYDFFARRLGIGVADALADALASGIYAANAKEISMRATFPRMLQMEKSHGSLLRAMFGIGWNAPSEDSGRIVRTDYERFRDELESGWGESEPSEFVSRMLTEPMYTLQGGLQTLTDALADSLRQPIDSNSSSTDRSNISTPNVTVNVQVGVDVESVRKDAESGLIRVNISDTSHKSRRSDYDGDLYDHVVSAVAAPSIASMIDSDKSENVVKLSSELHTIHMTSLAVVHLSYDRMLPLQGFGVLTSSRSQLSSLGITFDSCTFPPLNQPDKHPNGETRLTVMMGGMRDQQLVEKPHDEIIESARADLETILGIDASPDQMACSVLHDAIPQYAVGHTTKVQRIADLTDASFDQRLTLIGASFHGVSVNDCIANV